jgi:hypothetical protein
MLPLRRLRRGYQIDSGVTVLLSTEKPRCKLVDVEQGQNPLDYQVGRRGKEDPMGLRLSCIEVAHVLGEVRWGGPC